MLSAIEGCFAFEKGFMCYHFVETVASRVSLCANNASLTTSMVASRLEKNLLRSVLGLRMRGRLSYLRTNFVTEI